MLFNLANGRVCLFLRISAFTSVICNAYEYLYKVSKLLYLVQ